MLSMLAGFPVPLPSRLQRLRLQRFHAFACNAIMLSMLAGFPVPLPSCFHAISSP